MRLFGCLFNGQQTIYIDVIDLMLDVMFYHVVKPSPLLDHTNPKCEETVYNVLYCYVLCTVL